jgi:hypothetical protein
VDDFVTVSLCELDLDRAIVMELGGFGEKPVLKLMFGALILAADRWRGLRFNAFELRQIAAVRKKFAEEYQISIMVLARSSQPRVSCKSAP